MIAIGSSVQPTIMHTLDKSPSPRVYPLASEPDTHFPGRECIDGTFGRVYARPGRIGGVHRVGRVKHHHRRTAAATADGGTLPDVDASPRRRPYVWTTAIVMAMAVVHSYGRPYRPLLTDG